MIDETVYQDYFNSLLAGRRAGCMEIVGPLIQNDFAADTLYTDLFQRSLYQIGELWEQNRISVGGGAPGHSRHRKPAVSRVSPGFFPTGLRWVEGRSYPAR